MRIFVALVLPEPFKAGLIAETRILREGGYPLRWAPAENLHLTLAFLGELDEAGTALAIEVARRTAGRHAAFSLTRGNLVAYPRRGAARVLAAAINDGKRETSALASDFERELQKSGTQAGTVAGYIFRERETKPFTAHITLARASRVPVKFSPEALVSSPAPEASTLIERLAVFESRLHRRGTDYIKLAEFPLQEHL
jgi:2'-5' RNA ligase